MNKASGGPLMTVQDSQQQLISSCIFILLPFKKAPSGMLTAQHQVRVDLSKVEGTEAVTRLVAVELKEVNQRSYLGLCLTPGFIGVHRRGHLDS